MDPITSTIAAAVIPSVIEMLKGAGGAISRRWLGLSVDDQIKLETATVEKMKALAALDAPGGTPSPWVVDLRASFRYLAAVLVILVGAILVGLGTRPGVTNPQMLLDLGAQLVSMPFAFIFGERLTLALKGTPK